MRLISVNTGMPREVKWHGCVVTTGIFREAVGGRVALRKLNLDGDGQADLTVHGGAHKAEELPESWKEYFRERLGQAGEED